MSFANRLKEKRLECRMSMESLAILIGTSRQTIQRYESGRISRPPYEKIEALAAALGTTPGELIGWQTTEHEEEDITSFEMNETRAHIVVQDDAMAGDRILERDVVCYRADETPQDGALAVVTWDGIPMVRRLWHTSAGILLLASNSAYSPILVTAEENARLTILGTATVLKTLL